MASAQLIDQLKNVEATFQELTVRLADPDVATDPAELQRIAKAPLLLGGPPSRLFHDWQKLNRDLQQTEETFAGNRPLRPGAGGDGKERNLSKLRGPRPRTNWRKKLTLLLLPRDPNDDKNIMLGDFAPAPVGEEAGAVGRRILAPQCYTRYAEKAGLGRCVWASPLGRRAGGATKRRSWRFKGDQVVQQAQV
jgi:peptide chain release factor 1